MKQLQRYAGSLLLGASLLAPLGLKAASPAARPADDDHARRYYDAEHKDYHTWDARENAAYRHWWTEERHEREYRDYDRLNREQQAEYWRWRHEHANWR